MLHKDTENLQNPRLGVSTTPKSNIRYHKNNMKAYCNLSSPSEEDLKKMFNKKVSFSGIFSAHKSYFDIKGSFKIVLVSL